MRTAARNNYPPRSNQDLRNLWSKIVQAPAADEQKLALLYYVLRDCRQLPNPHTNFARRTYLPKKYQLLVTGLWELDRSQFSRALEHLTDPSLTPTFADEILLTLLKHPKCDNALATAYYIAVLPPLKDEATLNAYFDLLLQNNLVEAYYFAQRQHETRHRTFFERIVASVHHEQASANRAERAALLVGLPLTTVEDAWFEDCLLYGVASKLPGAKDSVMVRRIAKGTSITDSSALSRWKGDSIGGINWDSVRSGIADAAPN